MTLWLKRAIRNWLGLTGPSTASYPHRFVTLVNYRDELLGVDDNGDIYRIQVDYLDQPVFELRQKNPLEGKR